MTGLLDFDFGAMTALNQAYWASQAPAVSKAFQFNTETPHPIQRLRGIHSPTVMDVQNASLDYETLLARANTLADQGYVIDREIMLLGGDPYQQMLHRQQLGYTTWWPSMRQAPVSEAPGIDLPGLTKYDPLHPPVGSIKVSTNPFDYPAYVSAGVPTPPPPGAPATSPIGPLLTGKIHVALMPQSSQYQNGQEITVDGLKYRLNFSNIWISPTWVQE